MSRFDKYYSTVKFLESLVNIPLEQDYMEQRSNPQIYLDRMRYMLDLMGNPQKGIKYIHVTGTAGKGSVSNMLHSILYAAGEKVGLSMSPYTTTSIEKIKVGDKYISPDEFVDIVEYLKPFINQMYLNSPYGSISYFEIFTAVVFEYFRRKNCEWAVLEVGLGGRYTASNVIRKPVADIITNIGYDHTKVLGDTLEEIAYDKAGIIKKGALFFTGEPRVGLRNIFKQECKKIGAEYNQIDLHKDVNKELAKYVSKNLSINDGAIERGLKDAKIPCRVELIQNSPRVIIDGAHNESKMAYLSKKICAMDYDNLHLIFGMKNSKDSSAIMKSIFPLADYLYATRYQMTGYFPGFEVLSPTKAIKMAKEYGSYISKKMYLDPRDALNAALSSASDDDLIVITGSLYLCGELRRYWISEEYILDNRSSFKE